jgi:enoyl-[acyl-carrier-protein] reductase (NADH)
MLLESKNAVIYGAGGGRPQVADVAAFLASDRAAAVTGTIVNVTGGMVAG